MKKQKELTGEDIVEFLVKNSELDYCAICGKCHSVCPTYREDWKEIHSPRGRLNMITAWLRKDFEPGEKFAESIMTCLLCGACATACPREIKPDDAIKIARSHPDFEKYKAKYESIILNSFVTSQSKIKKMLLPLRLYQKTGLQAVLRHSVLGIMPEKLRLMESMIPKISSKSLIKKTKEYEIPENKTGKRALYFPGCAMNYFLSDAAFSTVTLMLKLGVEVIVPREFHCCGAPHAHEGEIETAVMLARKNIEMFSNYEFDYIITDCAACGAAIKKYPEYFDKNHEEKLTASRIAYKTYDISELLLEIKPDWSRAKLPEDFKGLRITFDNPCELRHGQKVKSAPVDVLRQITNIKFIPLPEADWCCGSAGAFAMREPEAASRIFLKKAEKLKALDVDAIITLNPGCYFQWKTGIERNRINVMVLYFTELLAKLEFV